MLSFWVIEKLDIIKHILPRIFAGCVSLSSDALSFQELKKALGYGIVIAVSPAAHAGFQIIGLQKLLPLIACKLTTLVRMNDYL